MSQLTDIIQVNLPSNNANFVSGNGEGIWVKVDAETKRLYDTDSSGGVYTGVLDNDSWYYPTLKCGDTIVFTMRGQNRPVCIYHGFLDNMQGISEPERRNLIQAVIKANQY